MPAEVTRQPSRNLHVEGLDPDNLAYVIYTSGTTGRPRGVLIQHRGVVNVIWYRAFRLLGPETLRSAVLQSSLSFDASVAALFVPLVAGGNVRVVRDLQELGRLLCVDNTSYLVLTPSSLEALMADAVIPDSVDAVGVGGEAMGRQLIQRVSSQTRVRRLINFYGPTEASIACTVGTIVDRRSGAREYGSDQAVDNPDGPVTIGRPTPNNSVYILDRRLEPVPVGVVGELHTGGIGLARGYLNRPGLTAEKFIADPFSRTRGARLYKTGDLARYLPDGRIEFLGRRDHQVKVRGFRIELEEVETVLTRHKAVRQAVVLARDSEETGSPGRPSGKRLVAYIVHATETPVTVTELRRYLGRELPDYMIPSAFVTLDEIPMTPNGKVDRSALPAPDLGRPDLEAVYVAPRTPVEAALAHIWRELLGLERIGAHDDFFDLGGHSLLATRVVSRIRSRLRLDLPLRRIFEAPTIAELAQRIETDGRTQADFVPPAIKPLPREEHQIERSSEGVLTDG
jgi:amino acid adenylation domain-containing protein